MLLTLFSLVLTIVLGGVFLVGLHRVVQWSVTALEARQAGTPDADRELAAH